MLELIRISNLKVVVLVDFISYVMLFSNILGIVVFKYFKEQEL